MDVIKAKQVLGIQEITEHTIREAFKKLAREYHPDSPFCSVSKEKATIKMTEIIDARKYLLKSLGTSEQSMEDDLESLMYLMRDIWKSGCIWDQSVEFPADKLINWVIHSPSVDAWLDYCQSSIVQYSKKNEQAI